MSTSKHWHYDYPRLSWDSGFCFESHKIKANTNKNTLALVDIDQVIRERDLQTVERNIGFVSEYALENEQISILEPTFVKVFRLTQLSVQYLQHCRKFLDNTVLVLKRELTKSNEENKLLKLRSDQAEQDAVNLQKKIRDFNSQHNVVQNEPIFQCADCPKAFRTENYLVAHVQRRHTLDNDKTTPFQSETHKLQLEIKELKERLNSTEKLICTNELPKQEHLNINKANNRSDYSVADLQHKFELLKQHVENELKLLQAQKYDQDKYERWFESLLAKFGHDRKEERRVGINSATQTESDCYVCKECSSNAKHSGDKAIINDDVVLKQLKSEIGVHLDKFEEALEINVSDNLGKLTNQIRLLSNKLNKLEIAHKNVQPALKNTTDQRDVQPFAALYKERVIEPSTERIIKPAVKPSTENVIEPEVTVLQYSSDKSSSSPEMAPKTIIPAPRRKSQFKLASTKKTVEEYEEKEDSSKVTVTEILPKSVIKISKPIPQPRERPSQAVVIKSINKSFAATSESESESSSDSSGSEESSKKIVTKFVPSTATALNKQAIVRQDTKQSTATIKDLEVQLQKIVDDRMFNLGVSPSWKGIPNKSFQQALAKIKQQAILDQKTIPNYTQIRKQILKEVSRSTKTSMIHQVDAKTKSSFLKGKKELLPQFRQSDEDLKKSNIRQPDNLNKISRPIKPKPEDNEAETKSKGITKSIVSFEDSESDGSDATYTKSKDSIGIAEVEMEDSTHRKRLIKEVKQFKPKTAFEDSAIKFQKPETKNDNKPEEETHSPSKGVLKGVTIPSQQQKKRVLFDLEEGQPVPLAVPIGDFTNDSNSSTSIASSVLEDSTANVMPRTGEKEKKQEDLSDWDLSEILK